MPTLRDERALADKVVVVTGAAHGLGRAYALDAAARGALLVLADVEREALTAVANEIRAGGGTADTVVGSVADWDDAARMVAACRDRHGRIDGLVNNAAILHVTPGWAEQEQPLRRIVEVNLLGTLFCGTHALRAMVEQGFGSLVNVTSGAHLGLREMGAYAATKGGVASLTFTWALDAAEHGVRVNALSPVARTRMSDVWEHRDAAHQLEPPPDAVAPLASYLLSDRSRHLSGQILRLDADGVSFLRPPRRDEAAGPAPMSFAAIARALGPDGPLRPSPVGYGLEALGLDAHSPTD